MKSRSSLPYLFLNIFVSALTTLIVLLLWNAGNPACTQALPTPPTLPTSTPTLPGGQTNLPPLDQPLVQVQNVFGAGDLQNEVVMLRNVSSGDLELKDWRMIDEQGNAFIFPELILSKDSALQIYSRAGSNNPITLFWGLQSPAWQPQEKVRILDPLGQERASYTLP